MLVEWDSDKAEANLRKHGVSFEQAQELLTSEEHCLEIFDEEHSLEEERFISIGVTSAGVLVVVWTERDTDIVRVISARVATKREEELFWSYIRGER